MRLVTLYTPVPEPVDGAALDAAGCGGLASSILVRGTSK